LASVKHTTPNSAPKQASDLSQIISNVPVPIYVWHISTGQVHYVNDAFSQRLGYDSETLQSEDFFNTHVLHPSDFSAWRDRFRDMLSTKSDEHFKMTFKLRNHSGEYERFDTRVAISERDDQGNPVYLTGSLEERIRLSTLKPNQSESPLYSKGTVFHCVLNNDLEFTRECNTFKKEFGKEQPINLQSWVDPNSAEDLYRNIDDLFVKEEGDLVFEVELKSENDSLRLLRLHLIKRKEQSGEVFVIITDISELKEKSLLLQASERQFASLSNDLSSFSMETDSSGQITYVSSNVERLLQFTPKEMMGMPFINILAPSNDKLPGSWQSILVGSKRRIWKMEKKHGSTISVLISSEFIKTGEDQISGSRIFIRDISEELLTQKKLRNAEEIGQLCTWEQDIYSGELQYHENALKVFNLPKEFNLDHIDKLISHIHPDDRDHVIKVSEKEIRHGLKNSGHHYNLEYRLLTPHDIRNVLVHCEVDSSVKEKPVLRGVTQDITEIKRSEQKVKDLVQRFETIVQNSQTWFWEMDQDMKYSFLSDNFTEITGYPKENALGRNVYEFRTQEQLKEVVPIISEIVRKRKSVTGLKSKFHTIDNQEMVIITNAVPKYDINGEYAGYLGSSRDVTKEEKIKAELKASSLKNKTILEAMPDTFFVINKDLQIIDYHVPRGSKLWLKPEEFKNKSLLDIYPSPEGDELLAPIHQAFKSNEVIIQEYENILDNGDRIFSESRFIQIEGSDQVLSITRDVTKEKLAMQALQGALADLKASNEELEQFAFMASHDLQEPVRLINSYIQLLQRELPKDQISEKAQLYLDFMSDSTVKMRNLIQELLDYSKLGSQTLTLESFPFQELVSGVLLNCSGIINQSDAAVETSVLSETLYCDPIQIARVFQNLISNSIKFTKTGEAPHILISHERKNGFDHITVSDRGIGIPQSDVHKVFQMFARIHPSSRYPGNGLGMAIAKKIIDAHGGEISIESEVMVGTSVKFSLPTAPDQ
jgi:PAS domain S-box-containing protein